MWYFRYSSFYNLSSNARLSYEYNKQQNIWNVNIISNQEIQFGQEILASYGKHYDYPNINNNTSDNSSNTI